MRIILVSFFVCYYCIYITHASAKCLEDQRSLLLQFKNNLTFDPETSTILKLWNNSTDCCYWRGVRCDNEGHVIGLDLEYEYFTYGGFNSSSSLFSLQHLQVLSLSYNNLNSSIPSGFNKLDKLTILDLANCQLYGTLPHSMSNLTHLTQLYLEHNDLSGAIPNSMSNLTHLTNLDLSHNDLTGAIPNSISNLTYLTYLDLSHNELSGAIPSSFFILPSLDMISLASNQFSRLDEFFNVSSSILDTLDLSYNYLSDPFPISIFQIKSLSHLDLSVNKFNGSLNGNPINVQPSSFPAILYLNLASCNMKTFPRFLINHSTLQSLNLSDNQIHGKIPNWIWKLQELVVLDLSHNFLSDLEGPLQNVSSNLRILDLHNNKLLGSIPMFSKSVEYMDYSTNNFSAVPQDIGTYLTSTIFLSLSNNNLQGSIPDSLCKASKLRVLDISVNNFSGTISPCLITMTETLDVLNLGKNNLIGPIPDMFPSYCAVSSLNFHRNLLHGPIPTSLSYCSSLEVIDFGSNQIVGAFPCFLQNIPTLSVLILRDNKFSGSIECSNSQANEHWKMIRIVDIAFNNFSGKLPEKYFATWDRMIHDADYVVSYFRHIMDSELFPNIYYQDSVTVVSKGQQVELVKIPKIFRVIDFSSNHFEGPIPEVLMEFKEVHVLNFSNNALSGEIPSTIGNLKQLESLDLSNNSLVGEIPMQIASLSFLSYLNMSFNHLVGKIPTGTQLQSFEASSFEGNYGLYGPPLTKRLDDKRQDDLHPQPTSGRLVCSIGWNFLSVELGFVFGLGIIIGPIMFRKQWRVRYWKLVDKILCWMFSKMYLEYATDRGQTYTVLRWRYH